MSIIGASRNSNRDTDRGPDNPSFDSCSLSLDHERESKMLVTDATNQRRFQIDNQMDVMFPNTRQSIFGDRKFVRKPKIRDGILGNAGARV
jgi:hypothetical protein